MKRLIVLTALVLLSLAGLSAQDNESRIVTGHVKSAILGVEKTFNVYLPAGYDTSGMDYPVLYLLHGAWGDHNTWRERGNVRAITDRIISEGMAHPVIIVMPDASGEAEGRGGRNMGYFNRPEWRYEDYFFNELIPHVEAEYRITADKKHRAIAGLSMGGGGSMVYTLRHPEMFSSCCPMSSLMGDRRRLHIASQHPVYATSIQDYDPLDIIGSATQLQLDAFRTVRFYIDCGDDDYLAESNLELYMLMRQKNIPLQFRIRDGGHTWAYWQQSLAKILTYISIGFSEP